MLRVIWGDDRPNSSELSELACRMPDRAFHFAIQARHHDANVTARFPSAILFRYALEMDSSLPRTHRNPLFRQLRARPRLFMSLCLGIAVAILLPSSWVAHTATRLLIAWNAATGCYLLLAGVMMARSSHERMRWRARLQDEGRIAILTLVVIAAVASVAAIFAQLATVKELTGWLRFAHIALAGLTILTSWAFTHTMFALHYAHDYYVALATNGSGGLDFPGDEPPDYGDFLYFACVIGTSGQTADVSFTSRAMRRVGLVHCTLAFLFNTTVLALTINIAASLV